MPPCDLSTPRVTDGKPAAGRRVREVLAGSEHTDVHHCLFLPVDWDPRWRSTGARYPVMVEYTGNYYPSSGSTGRIQDANLGYGLSGGAGWIWVVLPCVDTAKGRNEVTWWGDRDATVDYCVTAVHHVHSEYGGDPNNTVICGFSRGAIAASHIGLATEEIAALWRGFVAHDNFDGYITTWPYEGCDAASAATRLRRLGDRPVLVTCGATLPHRASLETYLTALPGPDQPTFVPAPVAELFSVPHEIPHVHTDLWLHKSSPQRNQVRASLRDAVAGQSG